MDYDTEIAKALAGIALLVIAGLAPWLIGIVTVFRWIF